MLVKGLPLQIIIGPFGSLGKRLLAHLAIALVVSVGIQFYMETFYLESYLKTLCLYIANDLGFTFGHMFIFYNLDLRLDWLKDTWRRFVLGVLFHTAFSIIAFYLIQLVLMRLLFGMNAYQTFLWFLEVWYLPLGLTLIIIVFTTTVGFFQKWKKSLKEEEQARAEMMAYKFESLKGQINPSFLFESFDALKKLIDKDENEAVEAIQKMSRLYRSVLESRDMELVSLEEELKLVELYFELLHFRFGDRLKLDIRATFDTQDWVVPVVLQNVIEMMLNQAKSRAQIIFELDRASSTLNIFSNIQLEKLDNFNVENLQKRYDFFTEQKIEIKIMETGTVVSIPILTEEI